MANKDGDQEQHCNILHSELLILIENELDPVMPHYSDFKTAASSYVTKADLARSTTATDILEAMQTRGNLDVGFYDRLIKLLETARLVDLQGKVKQKAEEIRNEIKCGKGMDPPAVSDKVGQVKAKSTLYRSDCHDRTKDTFVRTTLYDRARNEIEEKKAVLLLGGVGDGKSSITQYIAANCMEDYLPVSCNYPEEIQQCIELIQGTNIKLLLIFDDPVGGSYTQHKLVNKWVHMLEKLEMYLTQNEHKFLFAMRKTIWADCGVHFQKSKFFCNQIEVTSVNLTREDKVRMLEKYLGNSGKLSDRHKQKLVTEKKPIAFGQCCKLMSDAEGLSSEELVLLFEKPFSYLCSELKTMADKEKEKYAILCLVMLCGSTLECKQLRVALSDVKPNVKEIIEDVVVVLKGCGDLHEIAQRLTGTHLEKRQASREDPTSCEVYTFAHDSIQESVTMHYGERHPEHCLKYLKPVVVMNIARPHNYEKREQEFAINFPPENYKELARMFTRKVIDENGKYPGLSKVFDNPCVKDELFQSVWVDHLMSCSPSERTAFTQSEDGYGLFERGRCVLYYLAVSGAHTVLSYLCPDRQYTCKCDRPCVLWGAVDGNHEQFLMDYLMSCSPSEQTAFTQSKDGDGRCVLYNLAVSGAHTVLSYLCPDRQYTCKCRGLPCVLRGAVDGGHEQLVSRYLTAHTRDREAACRTVEYVCRSDHVHLLPVLFAHTDVQYHPDIAGRGLREAGGWGHVRPVDYLLTHHCTPCTGPDCPCVRGLCEASYSGHTDIVTMIITSHGQNVNTPVLYDGSTSLHVAALWGRIDLVKFLLSAGADINTRRSRDGKTSLDLAVENRYSSYYDTTDVVEFLRSKGGRHSNP